MATFLDVTGLEQFTSIFVFLFTWMILFGVLVATKFFGENKFIPAIMGLVLSIFVLLSPGITATVEVLAPWFTAGFLFIVLIAVVSKLLIGDFPQAGTATIELRGIVLALLILIFFVAAAAQFRENIDVPEDTDEIDPYTKPSTIIFHPKVMGIILLLAISVFTVSLLASRIS